MLRNVCGRSATLKGHQKPTAFVQHLWCWQLSACQLPERHEPGALSEPRGGLPTAGWSARGGNNEPASPSRLHYNSPMCVASLIAGKIEIEIGRRKKSSGWIFRQAKST